MSSYEFWGNDKPKCPHCKAEYELQGDDYLNVSYEDDGRADLGCRSCGKQFVCVTSVRYVYHTAVSDDAADDEEWGPQPDIEPIDDAEFGMSP